VNPLDRDLKAIESSQLFQLVRSRPEFLEHRWIVYSEPLLSTQSLADISSVGLFSAVGCDVLTGVKYVPDLKGLSVFDPSGTQRDLINFSRWFIAEPEYRGSPARFDEVRWDILRLTVSPLDPGLKQLDVRYAAFRREPPAEIAARMKSLASGPVDGHWLFELPDQ
jgi:hypothetical protein